MIIHFKDGKPFWNPDKRPDEHDFHRLEDGIPSFEIEEFREAAERWEQSSIAIKEPEFKYGDKIYDLEGWEEYIFKQVSDSTFATVVDKNGETHCLDMDGFSHYYEGQEKDRESFRWVEKDEYKWGSFSVPKWKPVDEPIEPILKNDPDYDDDMDGFEEAHLRFYKKKEKGLIQLEEIKQ